MDFEGIGRVATNTTLAACAGALVAVAWVYPRSKKWDVGISINGLLAGLVAITCPCYWVSPTGSIAIGAIAGVIMVLAVDFTEWVRVDDPCGAFAVHGVCGIWGTLSLGFFAVGNYGGVKGILYGGNANQLIAQIKGSATIIACTAQPVCSSCSASRPSACSGSPRPGARGPRHRTSTVHRRTTPSTPTWATRRSRRTWRVSPRASAHHHGATLGHPPADVRLTYEAPRTPSPPGGCAVRSRAPRGSGSARVRQVLSRGGAGQTGVTG